MDNGESLLLPDELHKLRVLAKRKNALIAKVTLSFVVNEEGEREPIYKALLVIGSASIRFQLDRSVKAMWRQI